MSDGSDIEVLRIERARLSERLSDLLGVVLAVASRDYSARAHVAQSGDLLDALAAGLNMMVEELEGSVAVVDNILSVMADALMVITVDGSIKKANAAACRMIGAGEGEIAAIPAERIFGGAAAGRSIKELAGTFAGSGGEAEIITMRGTRVPVSLSVSTMFGSSGALSAVVCVARDISERKRIEAERARLEEALKKQARAMLEMSTPLVPVGEGIVAMPLVGAIDRGRAQQILQELLRGIAAHRASVAIVDVTGVAGVDTEVAGAIVRAVQAARLIGARVILTGIRPEVASTLTSMNIDLEGVVTRATLKSGIAFAQALLEGGGRPRP
ncbi:MAG: PAS domain S-box protein [Polyangiaceae bacterium]|nr:PAS domain S-box protein [Polyangiaceae bacterium]